MGAGELLPSPVGPSEGEFVTGLRVDRNVGLGVIEVGEDNSVAMCMDGLLVDGEALRKKKVGSLVGFALGLLLDGFKLGDIVGSLVVGFALGLLVDGNTLGDTVG